MQGFFLKNWIVLTLVRMFEFYMNLIEPNLTLTA